MRPAPRLGAGECHVRARAQRARRRARFVVFALELLDVGGGGRHLGHGADALARAPDVLPGLGLAAFAAAEVHRLQVAFGQVVRVHAGGHDAGREVVAVHAGEQVRVDDVVGAAVDDGLLVGVARARLFGRDEGRADVGEVGAHGLRRQHRAAGGDGARQRDRAVEPLADFLDQRERALHARMAAGAGRHGDQAVGALLDRLAARSCC